MAITALNLPYGTLEFTFSRTNPDLPQGGMGPNVSHLYARLTPNGQSFSWLKGKWYRYGWSRSLTKCVNEIQEDPYCPTFLQYAVDALQEDSRYA